MVVFTLFFSDVFIKNTHNLKMWQILIYKKYYASFWHLVFGHFKICQIIGNMPMDHIFLEMGPPCPHLLVTKRIKMQFSAHASGSRAATDPADPDLLTTRIQNSRSGSVKKTFLLSLVQKFGNLKFSPNLQFESCCPETSYENNLSCFKIFK